MFAHHTFVLVTTHIHSIYNQSYFIFVIYILCAKSVRLSSVNLCKQIVTELEKLLIQIDWHTQNEVAETC